MMKRLIKAFDLMFRTRIYSDRLEREIEALDIRTFEPEPTPANIVEFRTALSPDQIGLTWVKTTQNWSFEDYKTFMSEKLDLDCTRMLSGELYIGYEIHDDHNDVMYPVLAFAGTIEFETPADAVIFRLTLD